MSDRLTPEEIEQARADAKAFGNEVRAFMDSRPDLFPTVEQRRAVRDDQEGLDDG